MTIFEFGDYKAFVRNWIRSRQKGGRGEVLRLASALSVHPTLVSQVLNGSKDFTLEQAHSLAEHMGLIALECEYLLTLVLRERSGTAKLKAHFNAKLKQLKQESLQVSNRVIKDRELTDSERAQFYSDWIYIAICLQISIREFSTIERVAEHFDLPRAKVAEIVRFLLSCGLLREEAGRLELGAQRTHLSQSSPFLKQHHSNWRLKSLQRASSLSNEELMFTAPMSLSKADFTSFRERLVQMIQGVFTMAKDSPSEMVACLNVDWIKVEP